jgi:hypothetical protein
VFADLRDLASYVRYELSNAPGILSAASLAESQRVGMPQVPGASFGVNWKILAGDFGTQIFHNGFVDSGYGANALFYPALRIGAIGLDGTRPQLAQIILNTMLDSAIEADQSTLTLWKSLPLPNGVALVFNALGAGGNPCTTFRVLDVPSRTSASIVLHCAHGDRRVDFVVSPVAPWTITKSVVSAITY